MRYLSFSIRFFPAWLIFFLSLSAQADTLDISAEEEVVRLKDRHVRILEDKEGLFTYPEITSKDFEKQEGTQGITKSVFWAKIQVRNVSDEMLNRLLLVDYPLAEKVMLFTGESKTLLQSGNAVPFSQQAVQSSDMLFPLQLKPGLHDIYLRMESPVVKFPLSIYTAEEYSGERKFYFIYYAVTGGFIILAIILNLIFYSQTRDRLHLSYVVYMAAGILTFLAYMGLAHQYLWPQFTAWNQYAFLSLQNLMIAAHIFFAADLLNLQKFQKNIYRSLLAAGVIFICNALLALFLPSWISYHVLSVLCMLLLPLGVLAGYYPLRKKYRPAYYYMAACLMFTFSIATSFARYFQEDPEPEGACRSIAFALAVEILIFSIAIGMRVKEHFRREEEAVNEKQETGFLNSSNANNDFGLTPKEQLILKHLSDGLSDKEISSKLSISVPTVKTHLRSIYQKLEVRNRTEAVNKRMEEEKVG